MGKTKENKTNKNKRKVRMEDSSGENYSRGSTLEIKRPQKHRQYKREEESELEPITSSSSMSSFTSLAGISFSESSSMGSSMLGKNKRGRRPNGRGPNAQRGKAPVRGKKAVKKLKTGDSAHMSEVIERAVVEAETSELSKQLEEWYYKQKIAEDSENQFPTLTRVRVEAEPVFNSFIRAMAVYPALALAKRSMGPQDTIQVGVTTYGRLWLGWAALCFDVWTRCIPGGGVSIFEDAHPHYRRFWHMVKPQVRGEFMFLWTPIGDFFSLFNTGLLGPTTQFLLTWTTGANDPTTGRRLLVNSVPVVNEQILRKEGLECAKEIFQNCLSDGYGLSSMLKVPKYQLNCSPAAFANITSDGSDEIELSATYELEVKFRKSDLDIAGLGLAVPRPGRVCIHKEGGISGTAAFHLKLVHPNLFKEWVTVLQKEFPITQYFTALMAMMVPATRNLEGDGIDQSLDNITMGPNNKFTNMTMGQMLTAGLLDACQRMIMGNSIGQLGGCYSGSTILGGDVRGFIPITTYGDAAPLALREGMKLISLHYVAPNAITRRSPIGKEYYVPVLSTRGSQFGANPLMVSDVPTFDNFVASMYTQATTIGGWTFDTLPNPSIPNFIDTLDVTNMYFVGPTPSRAIKQMNAVYASIQATLGVSTLTDTKIGDATLMYFSRVITKGQTGVWDTTMLNTVTQVSNRFPLSNQTLGAMPSFTPVFYADEIDPTTWFSVYGEYCSLLGDAAETFLDQVLRVFVLFAHQRATWGGFATNEFYIAQVYQGLGGGFFYGLSNAVTGFVKTVSSVGKFISGVHDAIDNMSQQKLNSVCSEVTSRPEVYGEYGMMNIQNGGYLDQMLLA